MTRYIPPLAPEETRDAKLQWLAQVIEIIGAGFHPDIPAVWYVDAENNRVLTAADAARLDEGLVMLLDEVGDARIFEETIRLLGGRPRPFNVGKRPVV